MARSVAHYIADGAPAPIDNWGWKNKALPAIHMPRGVSRLSLQLEEVSVERLSDITEADAIAEGIVPANHDRPAILGPGKLWTWPGHDKVYVSATAAYFAGWDSINGAGSAAKNPWLWRLAFRVLEPQHVGRPIIFSKPMVLALLAGRKTQTRRILNPQPADWLASQLKSGFRHWWNIGKGLHGAATAVGTSKACGDSETWRCPFGVPGDQLWCREGVRRNP